VEDLAFVEPTELASIEGFDEDTALEIQNRAKAYLERVELENEARRKELGVADELKEVDGITSRCSSGSRERREDDRGFRGLRADDLVGWSEKKDGETTKHDASSPGSICRARKPRR